MQRERAILGYLSEALNFDHGSTSSNGAIDHWDNDLHEYMIANSEPSHEQQQDEAGSSGTKNEASSSHSEQQRRNEIIDLDSDSEQPSAPTNQHVQNSNSPAIIHIPSVSRNLLMLPPFQWTEVVPSSTSSTVPVERDETRPRSIPESRPLLIPAPELGTSRDATSGNLSVASSVSRTGVQPPSYQNLPLQQRRRFEVAPRRSLISSLAGSGDDHPVAPPDGLVLQPGGDNSQMPHSRAGLWLDRQGDDSVAGTPRSFRALAASSRGRSRLTVSQVGSLQSSMVMKPFFVNLFCSSLK